MRSTFSPKFAWGFCAYCPRASGSHSRGEPLDHLAGFLAATDFHLTAVLFAFPLGLAEGVDELLKLGDVHHIHLIVGGDIGKGIAMGGGLVERPDIVEVGLALAHITAHEGKGGSLDADAHTKGAYVGVGAVVGAVVMLAVDAHIGAQVVLASDARVLAVADVVDGVGSH